jgi:putative hemolysin
VVPLYFYGQNSRLFQIASQISVSLRMGLFLYETINKMKRKFRVNIGEPIPYAELEANCVRTEMLGYLRSKVEALK